MISDQALKDKLAEIFGTEVLAIAPLSAAKHAEIFRVTMLNKENYVVKRSDQGLMDEAEMLKTLSEKGGLPVPKVYYSADTVIIMDYIVSDWHFDEAAQKDAAVHLSKLHQVEGTAYGYDHDTLIAGISQPNDWMDNWADFFITNRFLYMAEQALAKDSIDKKLMKKIDKLSAKLPEIIGTGNPPVLIHGDCWGGNILSHRGKIEAFLDPAVYYADHEIELAFSTLFNTFDQTFFSRYNKEVDIKPGFFEERRDIYNLYPLLTHATLFGSSYARKINRIIDKFL
jgi:fructosamine-3-kinase